MANASAKRIAAQNEQAVRNLRLGMGISTLLAVLLRVVLRRGTFPPSIGLGTLAIGTSIPAFFIYRHLEKSGTPRRDPSTTQLISAGEDLNQPGVTEWCFDVLYVTWACQVGSAAFGEWFWWLYLSIPLYAAFKIWNSFIGPMFFGKSGSAPETDEGEAKGTGSKRQEKLRKRSERGDPRVRTATVKN